MQAPITWKVLSLLVLISREVSGPNYLEQHGELRQHDRRPGDEPHPALRFGSVGLISMFTGNAT